MKEKQTSVIIGDIVNSRSISPAIWLKTIKKVLNQNKIGIQKWEIFRGDMFQLEINPEIALKIVLEIKASVKELKDIDVRIAIGIGTKNYSSKKVTESNGEAYINSGICFENLKKRRLAIKTPWKEFDEEWNIIFQLASLTMDNWAPKTAIIFKQALTHPELTQKELAKKLNRTQGTISEGLKRAGHEEISQTLQLYKKQITKKVIK